MEPRKAESGRHRARRTNGRSAKPKRFQIMKLEQRIAPKLAANHNETLVRDSAGKVRSAPTAKGHAAKPKRFQIVKLEQRIAPRLAANHNETLVRDRS